MSAPSASAIRFGSFEVDVRSGELHWQGAKVNLQDQPFQVLMLLLERAGEVVTREELSKGLWPDNSFIDFNHGLNKAINKLRVALKDDAGKPRYIETLPQRGYRFIALVESPEQVRNRLQPEPVQKIHSLAVLPLDNLSGDPEQEYFSDGMTEELIGTVARLATLRVISRTSVMQYKGARKSLPAIAKELRVDAIVVGGVARSGQKVRITAQLIHAADDRHLWSGRYERDLSDILQLQSEIALSIARQIHQLVDPAHLFSAPAHQVHPQAYEAYLKGNFFRDKLTPVDLEKSLGFYRQAILLDPAYAQAYGSLAESYVYFAIFGMGQPGEIFSEARANARKALAVDETVAAAHHALAFVNLFYDWDWAGAEAEFRRAVELNPGQSVPHAWLADYMSIRGRHTEAIAEFRRVLELDPISLVFNTSLGLIFYRARRYDESIEQCENALQLDPDYPNALWFLALSLEQKGKLPEAIAALEKAASLSEGPHYRALLGRGYALVGERTKALDIIDELTALSQRMYVSPYDIALVYVGLGDKTSAFQWLEKACQERVFRVVELTMPIFDGLRSDPRWQNLASRIGLPL